MSDFYREVILDHYKNPRGHGAMDAPDAQAEGMNPLCGDEVTISVALADDGETIDEVRNLIPSQYNTRTTLSAEVKPDAENTCKFDLSSRAPGSPVRQRR